MKTHILLMVVSTILISCGQLKENNMRKDAKEFLEIILKETESEKLSEIGELSAVFSVALNPNITIKKKSLLQKYQGDDLVKFADILKAEIKKQTGEDEAPDFIMLLLFEDNLN